MTHLKTENQHFPGSVRVRSLCAYAIDKLQEKGIYVHTPLITGSDCEGAGEMFQVTTLDMNFSMNEDGTVHCDSQDLLWQRDQPY